MQNNFELYKSHILFAYNAINLIMREYPILIPILSRTRAIASLVNDETNEYRLISGDYTSGESHYMVSKLGHVRSLYIDSKYNYVKAKECENILRDNNVEFIGETDLLNFRYEDKLAIIRDLNPFLFLDME